MKRLGLWANEAKGLFNDYRVLRERAQLERRRTDHVPEVVEMIRADVGSMLFERLGSVDVEAADYSRDRVEAKMEALVSFLRERYSEFVSAYELEATLCFVDMAFTCYEKGIGVSGESFAFIVSPRVSASTLEYQNELVPLVPALHYVPGSLRALMMMGVPPYVVDSYSVAGGLSGYVVCSPVYADSALTRGRHEFIRLARSDVQRTVDFASRKLNARLVGLGGVLPSLTRYGQTVSVSGTALTTGHAGTIALVKLYVERAVSASDGGAIGILGLGSIGHSIATTLVERFGTAGSDVFVYDVDERRSDRFLSTIPCSLGTVEASSSVADLIASSSVVVSAITSKIGVAEMFAGSPQRQSLSGKLIIDDSQPVAFSQPLVEHLGGELTWVVANVGSNIRRAWYDYASFADRHSDFFGCEAEVAVLAAEYSALIAGGLDPDSALEQVGELGAREAVGPKHVAGIEALFRRYGVSVGPPQAFASLDWQDESTGPVDLTDWGAAVVESADLR